MNNLLTLSEIRKDMKKNRRIQCVIMALVMTLGLQAQTYHDLIEKAMNLTMKDSLVQAEQLFKQALKVDATNARNALLFSNLGTVQKRMGKIDQAIESYTLGLNITPYATSILLNRAALYLDKGQMDKAYVDYCNVIDLLPENEEARLFRAYIYMSRRQYDEAKVDYNVILGKNPNHKSARVGLVLLDQNVGKLQTAHNRLNLLINDFPKDTSLLKMRANLELEENYPDAALVDLETVVQLDPKDAEAFCQIGTICLQMHKKQEALKAFEKAIALGVPRVQLRDLLKECN